MVQKLFYIDWLQAFHFFFIQSDVKDLLFRPYFRKDFFENINAFRSFITSKRIELIRVIHHQKPDSAYELAKIVGRDVKSVMTDLTVLKSLGLLELEKEEKHRERVKPFVDYDSLQVEIAV